MVFAVSWRVRERPHVSHIQSFNAFFCALPAHFFQTNQGFNMALDTLVSNAHGAKKYRLSGLYAQRAILIMTILSIPMACVWASGEIILTTLGLPDVAPLAGVYSRYLIVGLWPWLVNDSYKRYLQAQGIVFPMLASSAVCLPIHILLTYCLVFRWGLGFRGAALAVGLSNWNLLVSVVGFNRLSQWYRRRSHASTLPLASAASVPSSVPSVSTSAEFTGMAPSSHDDTFAALLDPSVVLVGNSSATESPRATAAIVDDPDDNWPPLSRDVLRGWSSFFKLGAPSAASLVLEWGSYEATAWAAGLLGSVELATHTIFMQTAALWYMIPLGISVAAATLTGTALGAGDTARAKMFARLGLQSVFAYALLNGGLYTLALRRSWPRVFSDDARVVDFASVSMPIMFIYGIFDATYSVTSGVLRSAGRPSHVALGNLFACLGVGAPCVYLFSFVLGWGLVGIWAAMTLTWAAATAFYSFVLFWRTDWEAEAAAAADRNLRATVEAQSSLDASAAAAALEAAPVTDGSLNTDE
jgi:Na+-driven multidrug efflux pump